MNISKKAALKNLSKTKFCTLTEAIILAENTGDEDIWGAVLSRTDVQAYLESLPATEAIAYAKKTNSSRVLEVILNGSNIIKFLESLPATEAVSYAKEVKNFRVWSIVLGRVDISLEEAFSLLKSSGVNSDSYYSFLRRTDMSERQALDYAKRFKSQCFWEIVLGHIVTEGSTALSYANSLYNDCDGPIIDEGIFCSVLSRTDIPLASALARAEKIKFCYYPLASVLRRTDMPIAEAITYAKKVWHPKTWSRVLSRTDMPIAEAITYAKKIRESDVWGYVLHRTDVKAFLQNLAPVDAIAYAKEIDYRGIWDIILSRIDVQVYLEN